MGYVLYGDGWGYSQPDERRGTLDSAGTYNHVLVLGHVSPSVMRLRHEYIINFPYSHS